MHPAAILRYHRAGRRRFINFDLIDGRLFVRPESKSSYFTGILTGVRFAKLDRPKLYSPDPEPVALALGLDFPSWSVLPAYPEFTSLPVGTIVAHGNLTFRTTACIYGVALTWHNVYGRVVAFDGADDPVFSDQIEQYVARGFDGPAPRFRGEFVEGSIEVTCRKETSEEQRAALAEAEYLVERCVEQCRG